MRETSRIPLWVGALVCLGFTGTHVAWADPSRIDYAQTLAAQEKNGKRVHPGIAERVTPVTSADFDQNFQPINANYPPHAPQSHVVQAGETLQSIARLLWGDGSLWYLLADANGLAGNEQYSVFGFKYPVQYPHQHYHADVVVEPGIDNQRF
jgi:nucleoid-associated protein YgaU